MDYEIYFQDDTKRYQLPNSVLDYRVLDLSGNNPTIREIIANSNGFPSTIPIFGSIDGNLSVTLLISQTDNHYIIRLLMYDNNNNIDKNIHRMDVYKFFKQLSPPDNLQPGVVTKLSVFGQTNIDEFLDLCITDVKGNTYRIGDIVTISPFNSVILEKFKLGFDYKIYTVLYCSFTEGHLRIELIREYDGYLLAKLGYEDFVKFCNKGKNTKSARNI
jgi:hypothetical protein